ncbi:MAG: DUF2911 domain-containing protein [Bacteroidia bacterium]|nr:DUF2911 domain-containing protein [Bacteroidia bacterium]
MKNFLITLGIIVLLIIGAWEIYLYNTKSHSPEADVTYEANNLLIHIYYNRPFKKGREIFGGLVPYGKVWRTGANEASIFETNKDLLFKGKTLKAGKYTLWSIPNEQTWTIIFNSEYGQWGISNGEANRDSKNDVLLVDAHALIQDKELEQFTIAIENVGTEQELLLIWDKTLVSIPFTAAQ